MSIEEQVASLVTSAAALTTAIGNLGTQLTAVQQSITALGTQPSLTPVLSAIQTVGNQVASVAATTSQILADITS